MTEARAYAGESREARVARRRRQLLDAGHDLFGTVGFRRATVRELCRHARVADRYFYGEFNGAEDLLLAVYDRCHMALREAVLTRVATLDADVSLRGLIAGGLDAFLEHIESDPALARVVWFEILGVNSTVERHHMKRLEEFGELIGQLVDSRGAKIATSGPARRVRLTAVAGGISQVAMGWVDRKYDSRRQDLVSSLVPFVLSATSAETLHAP